MLKKHKFTLFHLMGFKTCYTPKLNTITGLLTVSSITPKVYLFEFENKIRFSN